MASVPNLVCCLFFFLSYIGIQPPHLFTYCLWLLLCAMTAKWVVAASTVWATELKILTIWLFPKKKLADPCSRVFLLLSVSFNSSPWGKEKELWWHPLATNRLLILVIFFGRLMDTLHRWIKWFFYTATHYIRDYSSCTAIQLCLHPSYLLLKARCVYRD
jgi:hypothetical protein